jgi:oligopeptide transport system ATP-binding protein
VSTTRASAGDASGAGVVVRRRLLKRPPEGIRKARSLFTSIAVYQVISVAVPVLAFLLAAVTGGELGLAIPLAVWVPFQLAIAWLSIRIGRAFRTRRPQARYAGLALIAVLLGFGALNVWAATTGRLTDTAAAGAGLTAFVWYLLGMPAGWHLLRGGRWFTGERESAAAVPVDRSSSQDLKSGVKPSGNGAEPLVTVEGLKKHFPILGGLLRRQLATIYAVDGVDFEIYPGEIFSLVGESGCGKTTLGRTLLQLTPPTSGRVVFDGSELADVDPDEMRPLRRRMQIIFQDPFGSLNPRMPVSDIIGEGLLAQGITNRQERDRKVEDALEIVGLRREYTRRYPHEFSGGQRQRIGIARALALNPDFVVCDEPVSALDVSIQSQILNLLLDLRRDLNLTYLFITHNLSVVQYFSDRVAVMYLGKIAELGGVEELYKNPRHPYTVALLSAIPNPNPRVRRKRLVLRGDVPSPAAPPTGCRFHTRCWLRERLGNPENCVTDDPALREVAPGHQAACHWAEQVTSGAVAEAAEHVSALETAVALEEE